MTQKRTYDATPDASLMEDIGSTNFTVGEAIAELVANSIDAKTEGENLTVDILVAPSEIRIVDDGVGMDEVTLAEAVRLGVKMDAITGSTKRRMGMFGLGLKTAAASLGRYWEIVTRPIDGDQEFMVAFDLAKWRDQSGDTDFRWQIEIEARDAVGGPLQDRPHGTAVVVKKLRHKNPMEGSILHHLGNAYKPNIEAGDKILYNGDEARPQPYNLVEDSRSEVDLRFDSDGVEDEDGDYAITGWVGLDKQTHNNTYYGLNLYREGQLIASWNKDWFAAHLMTSRIMGDIHLDYVPVNFNKRGFQTQSEEWLLTGVVMKDYLRPIVAASREMSRGRNDPGKYARAVKGMQRALAGLPQDRPSGGKDGGGGAGTAPGGQESGPKIAVDAVSLMIEGERIALSSVLTEFQSEVTPWDYIYSDERSELQAAVNTGSLLYQESKDAEQLAIIALADSVASYLTNERGYSSKRAIEIRNTWLYEVLGGER